MSSSRQIHHKTIYSIIVSRAALWDACSCCGVTQHQIIKTPVSTAHSEPLRVFRTVRNHASDQCSNDIICDVTRQGGVLVWLIVHRWSSAFSPSRRVVCSFYWRWKRHYYCARNATPGSRDGIVQMMCSVLIRWHGTLCARRFPSGRTENGRMNRDEFPRWRRAVKCLTIILLLGVAGSFVGVPRYVLVATGRND